jgi:hypothetical protein
VGGVLEEVGERAVGQGEVRQLFYNDATGVLIAAWPNGSTRRKAAMPV